MAQQPVNTNINVAYLGLNLSSIPSQIKGAQYTYALNAVIEGFDGNTYTVQNEQGNTLCTNFPEGYRVIGIRNIYEKNIITLFLVKEDETNSQIGYVDTKTCLYTKVAESPCLGFKLSHPILKAVHRVTPKGVEVYWPDNIGRRYIDLFNPPYITIKGANPCDDTPSTEIDCNKLSVQPNFSIPQIKTTDIKGDGELEAGTYQFGIEYCNALGEAYTSVYSITNPLGIFDKNKVTQDFNYKVGASIDVEISDIDVTGVYQYFNLIVIKAVNNILTPYIVGTYRITSEIQKISYTGQNQLAQPLSLLEVSQKYPIYKTADDITTAQDILIWKGLTTEDRISYQQVASQIKLKWVTHRIKYNKLTPELIAQYRAYMRDEVYAFEFVPLLKNGAQMDGFHIPGRVANENDLSIPENSSDIFHENDSCEPPDTVPPKWKVYNTAEKTGYTQEWLDSKQDDCYTGTYEYGEFAYWESTELYPCDTNVWGTLANTPIRHHKFPDSLITHIHDDDGFIYPIGVEIDVEQVKNLILNSTLTQEQKDNIAGFKIVRGNRATNKSIVAKGLINNVLKYSTKDNQIAPGGGSSVEGPVRTLISRAISLLNSSYNNLSVFEKAEFAAEYDSAKDALNLALTVPQTSNVIQIYILSARVHTQNIVNGVEDEAALAYAQGALETIIAAGETATAFAEIEQSPDNIKTEYNDSFYYYPNYLFNDVRNSDPFLTNVLVDESSKSRYTFHSPDTSFYQPTLGSILKLETAEYGLSSSHIVQVQDHAKYQFISSVAYITALLSGLAIGFASGTYGFSVNVFNGTAAMTSYQAVLSIIQKIVPRKNFAYQLNATGKYFASKPVPNNGQKQRALDLSYYLIPGLQDAGDDLQINNFQRESSVYLKTKNSLPYVDSVSGVKDISKTIVPSYDTYNWPISSYYCSIKRPFINQYGQIYSYETIDTGFQQKIDFTKVYSKTSIYGGDTFINKFAYKSKIPFFIDNRVGAPDESDVFYNELSNVGRAKYWFSTDAIEKSSIFSSLFGIKAHNFYWNRGSFFNDEGTIFLFAYGIPYFFCESEVNVHFRQAYNDKEGNFYPHVGTGIPDEWLQEKNVTIQQDNTYFYNKTYSRQNQETNTFSHLPPDYTSNPSPTTLPFRAIFSEKQEDIENYRRNNWLVYRPAAKFDFPQNYGALTSIDGIESKQVLARFENKTLLYNALLTAPTSAAEVYLGQSLFSAQVPPIDYADTDMGFIGSQHKFLLKTEYGHITADAKRGQIFLLQGQGFKELTNENVSEFFTEFLNFKIKDYFPQVNIDNNYYGVGLHGVYDAKYNRFILSKMDYIPLRSDITFKDDKFYVNSTEIQLSDQQYFCNNSFTISYSFITNAWTSFHSYIPNFYVGNSNDFYTGTATGLWRHGTSFTTFNNFYGNKEEYIIEYPVYYKGNDEILQDVKDYSKILKYTSFRNFVETDDKYFTHAVIYNNQQCSGTLKLTQKPKNNLQAYGKYPIYHDTEKEILFTKSNSFYQFNTFWALNKSSQEPMWIASCKSLSVYKEINNDNMNYSKRAYNKAPLMSKDTRIRLINKEHDDVKFVSQFVLSSSQISFK